MLKIKICGLKDPENLKEVAKLKPDMVGFIFHESSPRNVTENDILEDLNYTIQKVGVFVDTEPRTVELISDQFKLNAIQLYHYNIEPFQYLRSKLKIIKAVSIQTEEDLSDLKKFEGLCDLFIFDAKGEKAGGNGIKFNWQFINAYKGKTPFLLSGGIAPEDAESLKRIRHNKFIGVDINSRFELEPGIKNAKIIQEFKNKLNENI